ncbi:MAG: zinc ribbon domain-containing protein [Clostridiales bacterium]|nr:zinc ribbon domain-containing protein [Clostridiales bacterium]
MKCDLCGAPVVNGKCSNCGKEFTSTETTCDHEYGQTQNSNHGQYYYDPSGNPSEYQYTAVPVKKKLTHRTWFIVLWLILFFPAGLFMMWKNSGWNIAVKIIITAVIAVLLTTGIVSSRYISSRYNVDDYSEIIWPESGIAEMIPEPDSDYGQISLDTEDSFWADIGKTSPKEYAQYVEACRNMKFNVDYDNSDSYYNAKNKTGYELFLTYNKDKRVMSIQLDAPAGASENTSEPDSTASEDTKEKKSSSSGVDPDFKATMDSYEEFFDDYIAFMKKYSESSDTSAMLSDYTAYMQKYSEVMSKLDAIDEDELNADERAYYTKVMSRITKKLSEANL